MVKLLQTHLLQEPYHFVRGRSAQAQKTIAKVAKAIVRMMERKHALCKKSGSTMHCYGSAWLALGNAKHLQCISSQR